MRRSKILEAPAKNGFRKGVDLIKREIFNSELAQSFQSNTMGLQRAVATRSGAFFVASTHTMGTFYALTQYRSALLEIRQKKNLSERDRQKLAMQAGLGMVTDRLGSLTTPNRELRSIVENATGLSYVHPLEGLRSNKNNSMTVPQELEQNKGGI